jgi:prepilin signal peptidase PulO-like enzyme (type II secretory pathway)
MSPGPLWISLLIALGIYSSLELLNYGITQLAQNPALGQGDIWLMSVLALTIAAEQLPFFVLMVGIISLLWGIYWTHGQKHPRFPMVPPISVAFMVVQIF